MKFRPLISFLVVSLILLATAISAQDVTPTPVSDQNPKQVVENYLESRDPNLLAENVEFSDPYAAQPIIGRDLVMQRESELYGQTFNLQLEPWRYLFSNDLVIVEFEYSDQSVGATRAIPSPGLDVGIPVVGIYQVQDGVITSVRMYYDAAILQNQLGLPGTVVDVTPDHSPQTVGQLTQNPGVYYGQEVTIDANVGRAVSDSAFMIYDDALVGRGAEIMVIAPNDLDFVQLADTDIRVHGVVQEFRLTSIEEETGMDLDDTQYGEFENNPVIVASSITNLETVETLQTIVDNPNAFFGETVTIEGVVGEAISSQAAFVQEDALLDADRILIIDSSGQLFDFTQAGETPITVTGTVQEFVQTDVENQFNFDLDDNAFADYEGQPVIIADSINGM